MVGAFGKRESETSKKRCSPEKSEFKESIAKEDEEEAEGEIETADDRRRDVKDSVRGSGFNAGNSVVGVGGRRGGGSEGLRGWGIRHGCWGEHWGCFSDEAMTQQ